MKIVIPKVVIAVSMADYSPVLEGQNLHVWVNPPMAKIQAYNDLVADLQAKELDAAKQVFASGKKSDAAKKNETQLSKLFSQLLRWTAFKKDRIKAAVGTDPKVLEWYADVWSQGPEGTHWTLDELQTLEAEDNAFVGWMITQYWNARSEHIERKKKV